MSLSPTTFALMRENTQLLATLAGEEITLPRTEYGLLLEQNRLLGLLELGGGTVDQTARDAAATAQNEVDALEQTVANLPEGGTTDQQARDDIAALSTRATLTHTTASLAAGASESFTLTLPRTFTLLSIGVSAPSFTRGYLSTAARDADASRVAGQTPSDSVYYGLAFDLNLPDKGFLSVPIGEDISLGAEGEMYMSIRNMGSSSAAITLTLEYLGREA